MLQYTTHPPLSLFSPSFTSCQTTPLLSLEERERHPHVAIHHSPPFTLYNPSFTLHHYTLLRSWSWSEERERHPHVTIHHSPPFTLYNPSFTPHHYTLLRSWTWSEERERHPHVAIHPHGRPMLHEHGRDLGPGVPLAGTPTSLPFSPSPPFLALPVVIYPSLPPPVTHPFLASLPSFLDKPSLMT